MTARDVLAALYHHFNGRWAMLTEITARPPRRHRYAAHEPPTCDTCGKPLHPARSPHTKRLGHEWEHRDEVDVAICDGLRKLANEAAYAALPADGRRWCGVEDSGPQPGGYLPDADSAQGVGGDA
jgi:hypothetical protein